MADQAQAAAHWDAAYTQGDITGLKHAQPSDGRVSMAGRHALFR